MNGFGTPVFSRMEDQYQVLRSLFNHVLSPICAIFGVLGNITCLLAIWHRNRQSSNGLKGYMYTFLRGLVFADLGYLTCFILYLYFEASLESKCDHLYFVHQILFPTWNAFKATSDFIVICMTINRSYVMRNITELRIQTLHKNTNGISQRKTEWSVYLQLSVVVIFSFTLHLPYYFFDKIDMPTCYDNATLSEIPDENPDENSLWYIYFVLSVGLAKLVPLLVIVALNIALVKNLKILARRRKKVQQNIIESASMQDNNATGKVWSVTNKASIKEQKLTILLVFIAVSYLVFTLPADITFVLVNLDIPLIGHIHEPLIIVTNFIETLNYAANFYIYCAVHREIRESFVDLCRALAKLCYHRSSSSLTHPR